MKQTLQTKGSSGIGRGVYDEKWEYFFEFTNAGLQPFPLPDRRPLILTRNLMSYRKFIKAYCRQT